MNEILPNQKTDMDPQTQGTQGTLTMVKTETYILSHYQKLKMKLGVVAHTCNPSTWEAEAGGFLSSWPAWSTE